MEKKIKIKSTSLTPLNETLQKLKLNDTITDFTPVIVEADGKFTSIMKAKEEFNPNDLGSSFETEEETEEHKETKEQLLNQAKDALKQTLTNSEELNAILKKIKDLAKEDGYNTWEVNKEKNTASLKSKNATIFKQNNNLCLSHNGKIELFKTVDELHQWLKDNGYPLPGDNIVIHESVEFKEDDEEQPEERNWLDLLNAYNDEHKDKAVTDQDDLKKNLLTNDTIEDYENRLNDYINKYVIPLRKVSDLKFEKNQLKKQNDDYDKLLSGLAKSITAATSENELTKLYKQKDNLDGFVSDNYNRIKDIDSEIKDITANLKEPSKGEIYHFHNIQDLLSNHNRAYSKLHSRFDLMDQGLTKRIDPAILQADKHKKDPIKFNRKFIDKDEDVEECCGGVCVGTAALGPAVGYTASVKKREEVEDDKEEELQEAFYSLIPNDSSLIADKRQLVLKFLTWYKRNAPLIKDGTIKLPKDFENTFDEIIEPKILSNHSDSMSKIWLKTIENRLKPFATKMSETKKIPVDILLQNLINKPNEKICAALSAELNSYIPDDEKYTSGKVKLIPGESLLATSKDNPNFNQRINWQKAGYQAKLDGAVENVEDIVKAYRDLKDFLKNKPIDNNETSKFTPEELELIKKYNLKPQTESIFESAEKYPWLNKVLGQRLVEDDTPADFATGSPISSDMSSTDTTSTSSTTSTSTDNTTVPDIDFGGDTGGNKPSFGDINIDAGGYSPDEGEPEVPAPNLPEYKIIDVLLNDDTNDVKVKLQNTETKETEIKDLEDIDV